jgi:hypothetical protein
MQTNKIETKENYFSESNFFPFLFCCNKLQVRKTSEKKKEREETSGTCSIMHSFHAYTVIVYIVS